MTINSEKCIPELTSPTFSSRLIKPPNYEGLIDRKETKKTIFLNGKYVRLPDSTSKNSYPVPRMDDTVDILAATFRTFDGNRA